MKFIFKIKLSIFYWSVLAISLFGMMIMFNLEISSLNFGDLLSLICALVSAFQIISISSLSKEGLCTKLINISQLGIISFVMFGLAMMSSGPDQVLKMFSQPTLYMNTIYGLLFMGIFSTAIGFYMQIKSQKKLKSHIASLIFLTESPIAALLAFFMLNEHMSMNAIVGSCIVLACVGILPFEKFVKRKLKLSLIRRAYYILK
jgi:drug/metabolite transporter (DMT)-like permease